MPTATYTPLATVTLASSATSVNFSSIPSSYRDLVVVYNGTATSGGDFYMSLNGDTTNTGYSMIRMGGIPAVDSRSEATREVAVVGTPRCSVIIDIMDYSSTDKHKTSLSRSNRGTDFVATYVSRRANTAAINSVGFSINGGVSFASGSTFNLYGIVG